MQGVMGKMFHVKHLLLAKLDPHMSAQTRQGRAAGW
jgi:hypothetical protein